MAWDRYRDQGAVFLGIVYQDTPSSAMSYMEEMGGDWPNAVDPDSATALAYGVYGVPETFFIDARGVVRHKQIGATSYDLLVREVQRLLSSREGA